MSSFDFFCLKKKKQRAPVCEPSALIKSQESQPTGKSKDKKNSAGREKALTDIWKESGSKLEMMPNNTKLWHGGTVSNASELDDSRALWCTNDPTKASYYDDTARADGKFAKLLPFRLQIVTRCELKLANFGGVSLLEYTEQHCNSQHNEMKVALRTWCLVNRFDGVININRAQDEVVVCLPRSKLTIVSATQL